ncbi:hypothetical protein BH09PLA1_BH09PLA1_07890 [soil metagenome]
MIVPATHDAGSSHAPPVFASARGQRVFDIAAVAIIAGLAAFLVHRGWGDWADPIYNTGRELHIAQQLARGKVLYRDIAHLNGPISQQFNVQLFRAFVARVSVLTIANLALLAGLLAMIWWLWRQIADPLAAAVACIVLLMLFALGPGSRGFNFALPYEHEATHGLIGAFAAICLFAIYLNALRVRWLIFAGFALGIVLLTKFGIFLSVLLPTLAGVGASLYAQRATRHQTIAHLSALLIPILIVALAAFSFLLNDLPVRLAASSTFGSARWIGLPQLLAMPWYREWLGVRSIGRSLDEILLCGLSYAALLGPPFAAGIFARRRGEWRTAAVVVAPAYVLAVLFTLYDAISWQYAFRGLTLLILAMAIALGAGLLHRRRALIDRVLILRLTIVWFALLLLLHLGMRAVIFDYGFVFALPATLIAIASGVSWVPAIAERGGGFGWPPRAAMLAAVAVLITYFAQRDIRQLNRPRTTIGEGIDALKFDRRGEVVAEILRELRQRAGPNDTLLVAPDGAMLNYLSGLPNPTPYFGLMPPEIAMFGGQMLVRDAIAKSPPDWFVLTSGEAESFGFKSFTIDYGHNIWSWIEPRYSQVATAGNSQLAMRLFRRNTSGASE